MAAFNFKFVRKACSYVILHAFRMSFPVSFEDYINARNCTHRKGIIPTSGMEKKERKQFKEKGK